MLCANEATLLYLRHWYERAGSRYLLMKPHLIEQDFNSERRNLLMHSFEIALSVSTEEIEFELRSYASIPWADHLLNPRRLRGSDFLMRWSQGVWSEERLVQAVNETRDYFALPYGPSGTAPTDDPRAFELYFERLENAGLGKVKRPDLLIFKRADGEEVNDVVRRLGGVSELPFTREDDPSMQGLLSKALLAIECENSLW